MIKSTNPAKKYTSRKDFLWGINGHTYQYSVSYQRDTLEKQIILASQLGCKLYRTNGRPSAGNDYLDETVLLCEKYGMKVMFCVTDEYGSDYQTVKELYFSLADRYNGKSGHGKVDYFQLFNETDLHLLSKVPSTQSGDGKEISCYNVADLDEAYHYFKAAIAGIKEADTDAKSIINFCWTHYGMLEYLSNQGLEWDIIGLDWYTDMKNAYVERFDKSADAVGVLDIITKRYSNDIIICETNMWRTTPLPEENAEEWNDLLEIMGSAYENPRVKGVCFYEMIDELVFEYTEEYQIEAHFGLVFCDKQGNIGGVKPVYTAIQSLICD